MFLIGSQITVGQQAPVIKRTDLLKTALPEMEGKDMNVWVADIPPSASTGLHSHPTPRFVYVIEGAVVYEVDGKQPQTFPIRQQGPARRTSRCLVRSITSETQPERCAANAPAPIRRSNHLAHRPHQSVMRSSALATLSILAASAAP
jgi:Cupin domain